MDETSTPATTPATMREHWQEAQGYLRIMVSPEAYALWLEPLRPLSYAGGVLTLSAPDQTVRGKAERLTRLMHNALLMQTGRAVRVEIVDGASC